MGYLLASAVVCIVGALVYALSSNGKLVELGRIAFFVGLFWLVAMLGSHPMRLP